MFSRSDDRWESCVATAWKVKDEIKMGCVWVHSPDGNSVVSQGISTKVNEVGEGVEKLEVVVRTCLPEIA